MEQPALAAFVPGLQVFPLALVASEVELVEAIEVALLEVVVAAVVGLAVVIAVVNLAYLTLARLLEQVMVRHV